MSAGRRERKPVPRFSNRYSAQAGFNEIQVGFDVSEAVGASQVRVFWEGHPWEGEASDAGPAFSDGGAAIADGHFACGSYVETSPNVICSYTITSNALGDGTHAVRIEVEDDAGNITQGAHNTVLDFTPPVLNHIWEDGAGAVQCSV